MIMPLTSMMPMLLRAPAPGPVASTSGKWPMTVAAVVIRIGRNRVLDASPEELVELERDSAYRPTPLMLHKLSRFFQIPQRKLALLAGAIKDIPAAFCQQASSFAAQSESFSKLTNDERKLLDEFVKFLRTEVHEQ